MKLSNILILNLVLFSSIAFAQNTSDEGLFKVLGAYVHRADSAQNRGDYIASEEDRRRVVSIMTQAQLDPVEIARQTSNLASILNINGKPIEAEKFALKAKELLSKYPTDDRVQLAVLSGNLAEALRLQGKLDQAKANFVEELLMLSEIGLDDTHYAASANAGLGAIEAEIGNFRKALEYYEQAIPIFLSISDESHPVTRRYLQDYEEVKSKVKIN